MNIADVVAPSRHRASGTVSSMLVLVTLVLVLDSSFCRDCFIFPGILKVAKVGLLFKKICGLWLPNSKQLYYTV